MLLPDLYQFALQHAPRLAQSREQVKIRGWQRDQAEAKLRPSLDATSSEGLSKVVPTPWAVQRDPVVALPAAPSSQSTPWFGQLGLTLSETFYDNGESLTQIDLTKTDLSAAEVTTEQTRDEVLLATAKAYYAWCQSRVLLATSRQHHELLVKQLRQLDAMYHQGLKTQREFLRLQSEVQRAAVDERASQTAVLTAEVELRRTIGASTAEGPLEFAAIAEASALKEQLTFPTVTPSVARSFEARLAKLEDYSAGQRIELARRKNLPQLTLSSAAGYQNPDYLGFQGSPRAQDYLSWNLTLGVTYNLWDSGTRRNDIAIAATQQAVVREDGKDKLDSVEADIARLMDTLTNLKDTWQLNRQLIALEQDNLTNIEQDYREGKVGYLDLVSGLNAVLSAKVNFYTTYFSTLQALAEYRYHEGTIFDAVAGR